MPAARPSEAAIARALKAWQAAGLTVGRLTITDGAIIIESLPAPAESPQPAMPKQWRTG
jgi:hypothetical protein